MRRHVAAQAPLVAELLAAESAGVHPPSPMMLCHVPLQRGQVTEAAATRCALEGLVRRVHAPVGLEVTHQAEFLSTDGAAEGFLPSVQTCVQLLRQDGLEAFAAGGARPAALLVRLQVSRQLIRRVHPLATDAAEPVSVGGTNLQDVFEQVSFAVQRATAHLTQEGVRRTPAPRPGFERRPPPPPPPDWTWGLAAFCPVTV